MWPAKPKIYTLWLLQKKCDNSYSIPLSFLIFFDSVCLILMLCYLVICFFLLYCLSSSLSGMRALREVWQGLPTAVFPEPRNILETQMALMEICWLNGEWFKVQSLKYDISVCVSYLCLLLAAYLWATLKIHFKP